MKPLTNKSETFCSGRRIRSIVLVVMLSWITLLSSCGLLFRFPGEERHSMRNERHDRHDHDDHNEHRDHDEHHD